VRFAAVAPASEAMVQEPQTDGNPESRCRRVISSHHEELTELADRIILSGSPDEGNDAPPSLR